MKQSTWVRGLQVLLLGAALTGCRGNNSPSEVVKRPPSYPSYPSYPSKPAAQVAVSTTVVAPTPPTVSHPVDSGSGVIIVNPSSSPGEETSVLLTAASDKATVKATVATPASTEVVQASVQEPRLAEVSTPAPARKSYVDATAQPCFAHAPDYTWVSGQLVHFGRGNKWRLRYLSVDETDSNGGSVTLLDEGQLQNFQDGQYVRVEGVIGQGEHGIAPEYQISSIKAIDKPEIAPQ